MAINNWGETVANGRRRVFRIEIDRPLVGEPVARFHLERVFVDSNDIPVAQASAGSWDLPMGKAIQDPELSEFAIMVATGLETLSQKLYDREIAAANAAAEEPK